MALSWTFLQVKVLNSDSLDTMVGPTFTPLSVAVSGLFIYLRPTSVIMTKFNISPSATPPHF